jgi:hypothetical protein
MKDGRHLATIVSIKRASSIITQTICRYHITDEGLLASLLTVPTPVELIARQYTKFLWLGLIHLSRSALPQQKSHLN